MEIISHSAEETFLIGKKIGENASPGLVIAFYGDLGAGKTVMTKGIARGLGIQGMITSPTFTILQIAEEGRLPLYHLDVYRIDDPDEMEEIGLDDCLYGGGVTVIEWAERIEELLPADTVRVTIERLPENADTRRITIENLRFEEKLR
ncbi:MAG: tRNA (adenosine(37)-N6)-threonylcarbamoyltransferase complex ATPase subunit type 1 TsaE [Lachnospiraceae bacterium]|nr:tRNA (adenosine(37)-N6)-threonylcarbamoyltransferase complex ATPase subunit type 1 TsaE [Lachnospiraceae bacterium]